MTIDKKLEDGNLTVALEGSLDITTSPQLEAELNTCIDDANSILFDFTKLNYISSAGLRILVSAHKKMYKKGGMKVIGVNDTIMEVFDITGLADSFEITPLQA